MYSYLYIMYTLLYIFHMKPRHDVTNHLRAYRRAAELTQEQLAGRVGVTRQTILSIERGRYNPSVGLALLIARVFDVPVESIFQLDPEPSHE